LSFFPDSEQLLVFFLRVFFFRGDVSNTDIIRNLYSLAEVWVETLVLRCCRLIGCFGSYKAAVATLHHHRNFSLVSNIRNFMILVYIGAENPAFFHFCAGRDVLYCSTRDLLPRN
jgi:hypothetical protein